LHSISIAINTQKLLVENETLKKCKDILSSLLGYEYTIARKKQSFILLSQKLDSTNKPAPLNYAIQAFNQFAS